VNDNIVKIYCMVRKIAKYLIAKNNKVILYINRNNEDVYIKIKNKSIKKFSVYCNGEEVNVRFVKPGIFKIDNKILLKDENIFKFADSLKNIKILNKYNIANEKAQKRNYSIEELFEYLMNTVCNDRRSPFYGLMRPAYDFKENCFRILSWVWCSSIPVYSLCLKYSSTKEKKYLNYVKQIGESLLRYYYDNNIYDGGCIIRWDIDNNSPRGMKKLIAPNDLSMIASHAFIPLYKITKEDKYLIATEKIANWILKKGTDKKGIVYCDYNLYKKKWTKDWLYVDSGFTLSLYSSLFSITKKKEWLVYGNKFITEYNKRFFNYKTGLFYKTWYLNKNNDDLLFTRGQAWALEGLISYFEISGKYEKKIRIVIGKLLEYQNKDGSWNQILDRPIFGKCNKGTPIICYELLRYYKLNKNPGILQAIIKGMTWCEKNMRFTIKGYGGISSFNEEGSISGKRCADIAFTYSLAYYLMVDTLVNNEGNIDYV